MLFLVVPFMALHLQITLQDFPHHGEAEFLCSRNMYACTQNVRNIPEFNDDFKKLYSFDCQGG